MIWHSRILPFITFLCVFAFSSGIASAQVGNSPGTVYYNNQQMGDIVNDLRTKSDYWLPERLLKFQFICSYDVEILDSGGRVVSSYHAQHPFTRGISLNLLAETLLYGNYTPDFIVETEKQFAVVYRTLGYALKSETPSSLADMNGRIINIYSPYWNRSIQGDPSFGEIGVYDTLTAVYFDKETKRLEMIDTFSEGGKVASLHNRYKAKYSSSNLLEKLEFYGSNFAEFVSAPDLKYEYRNPTADSYFRLLTTYNFDTCDGIGYIKSVTASNGRDSFRISNFKLEKWQPAREGDRDSWFDFWKKHVYTTKDPTF